MQSDVENTRNEFGETETPGSAVGPRAVDHALAELPRLARELTGADYAAVTVQQSAGDPVQIYHAGFSDDVNWQAQELPKGVGVLGRLGEADSPLRLADISSHPDSFGFPEWHPEMKALLGVGVVNSSGMKANLYLANSPGKPEFTIEDEYQLIQLTNFAQLALDFARSYDLERESRIAAESAESRLQAVMDGSMIGIVVVDAASRALRGASEEASRLLDSEITRGTSLADIDRKVDFFDLNGRLLGNWELPLERALATGATTQPSEFLLQRADGSRIPILVASAPITTPDGTIESAVLVLQDLSQVYEAEDAKNEFLSMVTHDLRSPLATIKGIVRAMNIERELSEELSADLGSIDEEVDHMTGLVSNLLDMSRIESGTRGSDHEMCHMADILHDAVRRTSASRFGSNRRINVDIPTDLPEMYADPVQLGRVLDNLLGNAMKYTTGDVRVACIYGADGDLIRTEVIDIGEGIPEPMHNEIFEKFFRLSADKRVEREGSGLGLAICKSIVGAHGGDIGVVNNHGSGSTFWFEIPRDREQA